MTNSTWQLVAALLVVLAAAFVLARRVIRFVKGKQATSCGTGSCGSCASDGSATGLKERPLVQLGISDAHDRANIRKSL